MSWEVKGIVNVRGGKVVQHELKVSPQVGYGEEEGAEQEEATVACLFDLLETGRWGEGWFQVLVNGHGNPGHIPETARDPDRLSVVITRQSPLIPITPSPYPRGFVW